MTKLTDRPKLTFKNDEQTFYCEGNWSITTVNELLKTFDQETLPEDCELTINGKALSYFDSASALALHNIVEALKAKNNSITLEGFQEQHQTLFDFINKKESDISYEPPPPDDKHLLYRIGEEAVHKLKQAEGFVNLVGDLNRTIIAAFGSWKKFRIPSIVSNISSAGVQALPIVGLLSFLIGVVLAYQMGLQLQTYGASNFIAYLSGMALFREFSPLITAIIVAGRTSSAFTAQLGSMKINEEIDALQTMGLSPTELLVMPKVIGLILVFPLLIFWSDCFSIMGAMLMSKNMLDVGFLEFLSRLKDSVGLKQLMLGLYKAPVFALLISLVGCYQGFLVESNADSIGTQTTKSVVQALFLIIIADAIFSIIYSWMNL